MIIQDVNPPCHLCGSGDSRFLFYGRDRLHKVDNALFRIYRCNKCGLIFLFPQPAEKELQKYYPEEYGPYHNESRVLKYGAISRVFKKIISFSRKEKKVPYDMSIARLLDFGCGGGAYLEHIRILHPYWELYGFDTNEFARAHAHAKGFTVMSGAAEKELNKFKGYFDYIHLGHVIEHLPNPRATLSFLRTLLRPSGELHMTTPNVDSVAARLFGSYWFALDTPRHLFLFSPATISRLLSETGFTVKAIQCTRDMGVEIRSLNYLFERSDMRISFILWHLLRIALIPAVVLLASREKTSVMSIIAIPE